MLIVHYILLPVFVSANWNHDGGISTIRETLPWIKAYSKCRDVDMNIFNKSSDVTDMRNCHNLEYDIWISHPINLNPWKLNNQSVRDDYFDECLVLNCSSHFIEIHTCNEQLTCVCDNKEYSKIERNMTECRDLCQRNKSKVIEIHAGRDFCRENVQNTRVFWGNDKRDITSANISEVWQSEISDQYLCATSTARRGKKFKRCNEGCRFICVTDEYKPCVPQISTTRNPTSTTGYFNTIFFPNTSLNYSKQSTSRTTSTPSSKTTSSSISNTKYSTSRTTSATNSKTSLVTYTPSPTASISNTHFPTTSTSVIFSTSATASSTDGIAGGEMNEQKEQTDSSTILVAVVVTSVIVVAALLVIIFLLFRRMRRLTENNKDTENTGSNDNEENESRARGLYEDPSARLSQHEYQEIDKVQPFRKYEEENKIIEAENTYTEVLPDMDTNYVILENNVPEKGQLASEKEHNQVNYNDERDTDQKENTSGVDTSFDSNSTYFVLKKI